MQNDRWEMRVVDTGEALTLAKVTLDPFGLPATTEIDIFYADDLATLSKMIDDAKSALSKPVLSLRNLV